MRSNWLPTKLSALVVVTVVAACTSRKEQMIAQGVDPAYALGYEDGCSSGNKAGGGAMASDRQDTARYGADAQYTKGWDDAFQTCKEKMEVLVRDARRRNPSRDK